MLTQPIFHHIRIDKGLDTRRKHIHLKMGQQRLIDLLDLRTQNFRNVPPAGALPSDARPKAV